MLLLIYPTTQNLTLFNECEMINTTNDPTTFCFWSPFVQVNKTNCFRECSKTGIDSYFQILCYVFWFHSYSLILGTPFALLTWNAICICLNMTYAILSKDKSCSKECLNYNVYGICGGIIDWSALPGAHFLRN